MFIKTEGPPNAEIMLVGEAPGRVEDALGKPFKGNAGKVLDSLLYQAGIARSRCLIANVAREKPPANKISYYFQDKKCTIPKPKLQEWIALLKKEIQEYRPNIVVALGKTALWALTGNIGIKIHRGYITESTLVPGQKVLPTYHPQAVGYQWSLAYTVILDLKKALYHSAFPDIPKDNRTFVIDPTKSEFIDICKQIIEEKTITAVDIESTKAHPNRIGFCNSKDWGVSIGILRGGIPAFPERDEIEIWEWIGRVLSKVPLVFHNATYDIGVLFKQLGLVSRDLYMDTMIAAHCCWPELPAGLDYVASVCLDVSSWKQTSRQNPAMYNALDVMNTRDLVPILQRQLTKLGVEDTFKRVMSWVKPACMLQLQGLDVNLSLRDKLVSEAEQRLKETKKILREKVGQDINYNSPKQVSKLLYIDLRLPAQFKRRKSKTEDRKITSDEKALKKLAILHEVPALIIKHRKASKLISSFLDISTSPEGKVHSSYNVTGTSLGGRWSSSHSIIDPYGPGNLQNIPSFARKLYTMPKGHVLVGADYVQAEAVVVAYLCLDTVLMKMFKDSFGMSPSERKKGYDIHRYTASVMYGVPLEDITKEQRRVGKTLRHACNYAAGPATIADKLEITMSQAKVLANDYYSKNHLLVSWHNRIKNQLQKDRCLTNLFGRRHRFLDRWGDSLFRRAYAYIPQTSVGDLLNDSLTEFYNKYGHDFKLYLQLHDAMYVICRHDETMDLMKLLRKVMIKEVPVGGEVMKIDVDFKVGDSWGKMEEQDISWRNNECEN